MNLQIDEARKRVSDRVIVLDNGCWQWVGCGKDNGYGVHYGVIGFRDGGKRRQYYAHRFSYIAHKGNIPDGYEIDHLCRRPMCVNPEHLEAVTRRENLMRGNTVCAINAAKTQCPAGHEYSPDNTRTKDNVRKCRACDRVRRRRYVAANYEAVKEKKRLARR
jgi:hypothetical protein